jgi:hypothetical protein
MLAFASNDKTETRRHSMRAPSVQQIRDAFAAMIVGAAGSGVVQSDELCR